MVFTISISVSRWSLNKLFSFNISCMYICDCNTSTIYKKPQILSVIKIYKKPQILSVIKTDSI